MINDCGRGEMVTDTTGNAHNLYTYQQRAGPYHEGVNITPVFHKISTMYNI